MADYGVQRGAPAPRQNGYPHASNNQREAAYSDIFGAAPPGRSHTMTNPSMQLSPERSQTMNSMYSQPSMGPSAQPGGPAPVRPGQMRPPPPDGYGGPPMTNGYYPNPRQPNGLMQQQLQPQYLPQPLNPERRPYPQPQRINPRNTPPQMNPPFNRPIPNRGPPPGSALNTDPYRSRSMANMQPPPNYRPAGGTYDQATAHAFRQGPHQAMPSRTTAQGRMIPERHDDRAMSMTSWSAERDRTQTMSGRIIPNRRRESGQNSMSPEAPSPSSPHVASPSNSMTSGTRTASMTSGSRSMSMASTVTPERYDSMNRPAARASGSSGTMVSAQLKSPLVYPALLSRVAEVFLERIDAKDREKNQLSYKLAFTGKEAVDLIAYIIKTTDRNLALLLGRALDAQKFFHDVTYEHRLRDSSAELYQFKEAVLEDPSTNVNGVFTLLTDCYSPTCTRDRLCYSIACPRRLEQQSRLNLKPQPGLRRQASTASLHADEGDEQKLWINTVSQEVADSIDEKERKRQEVISEIMYTERDFVKDLEYLHDFWIKPLRLNSPSTAHAWIPEQRREKFLRTVFSNCMEVHSVNAKLAEALTRRQQENPVVRNVGDIFLNYVPRFEPFVAYGAHQLFGKYEFEREKANNPAFSRFVDETERLKESRKLELNGYLTKPTTRLARYPLLLEQVLKNTKDDNPDKQDLPKAVGLIREFLTRVNIESGKAENRFNLMQLSQNLKFPADPTVYVDLKLAEEGREIIYKGGLKKSPTDTSEIMVYLFDHAVLLAKAKVANKKEELRVYRRPIPLELLVVSQMDEAIPKQSIQNRPSSSLSLGLSGARQALNAPKANQAAKDTFPITFKYLGKPSYEITLYAPSALVWRKWLENIEARQSKLRDRIHLYTKHVLCQNFFTIGNKVNCLTQADGGRKLVYGTDTGIFVSKRQPHTNADAKPRKVLDLSNVTQIHVLEEYQLLLVLANKALLSFSVDALDTADGAQSAPLVKKPKKIQNHASFFQTGVCVGRHLVCSAKTSGMTTTIRVFEPLDTISANRRGPTLSRLFQGSQDALKPFKEFYIPTEKCSSMHFLKTKLCVACARGFEIVSLETLETQPLLDQADTSLDFVALEKDGKPIHIERLNGEFLLNYSEFSFFVNRNGWRARPDWRIDWEGSPNAFALCYPYILAFEPSFIEVRHIDTGACLHILTAKNIRMLHTATKEIIFAYEEETGEDVVAALDFWGDRAKQ